MLQSEFFCTISVCCTLCTPKCWQVRKEILECYALVQKLGKGVVYFGSSRTKADHPHYLQAMELAREVALLLNCTSWTGVGPGMMDAVTQGALQALKPVGGFKITIEGGTWTDSCVHPYLSDHTYMTCRFFSARKHGFADAGVRDNQADRTAFVSLPGGVGTLDEIFEISTLIQLQRLGSAYPVPLLVLNYDGFFTGLLQFLKSCQEWGTVSAGELDTLWKVCNTNLEALEYLADFYGISESDRLYRKTLQDSSNRPSK
jgi:predicted Rossmann-fold nucleotide-binding protein